MKAFAKKREQPGLVPIQLRIADRPCEHDLADALAVDGLDERFDACRRIVAKIVSVDTLRKELADAPGAGAIARTREQDVGEVIHARTPRRSSPRAADAGAGPPPGPDRDRAGTAASTGRRTARSRH